MQIIFLSLGFLVIIAAFVRLYDVFTSHMEHLADEELQKYMQANKARTGQEPAVAVKDNQVIGSCQ